MKNELKENEEIRNVPHNEQQRLREVHGQGERLRTFHLFAGAGGGILADLLLGHIPVGACEIEEYPRAVLLQRQRDGIFPEFPVWDDITTLDGKPWRGLVDIVAGGFPCQDISSAGKGSGISGERSGLWKEMARFIDEVRPRFAFLENSPMLTSRGLGVVLGDLAEMGYNARWGVLGSSNVGGFHKRKRIWIVAHAQELLGDVRESNGENGESPTQELRSSNCTGDVPNADRLDVEGDRLDKSRERATQMQSEGFSAVEIRTHEEAQSEFKPGVGGVAYGVAHQSHRLKAIGNGQDPRVASTAWKILTEDLI